MKDEKYSRLGGRDAKDQKYSRLGGMDERLENTQG